jgi:CDP-diglyceride synthetase
VNNDLLRYLIDLLPIIPGGVLNMAFVKSKFLQSWAQPLDGGLVLSDGKRLFGANKTWKGVIGMIVFTAICTIVLNIYPTQYAAFRSGRSLHDIPYEGLYGATLGLAYVLAELPNSFIKRRLDIAPGKNATGIKGILFTIIDQADSIIGGAIVISLYTPMSTYHFWQLVLVASAIHYAVNVLLYFVRLKSQAG